MAGLVEKHCDELERGQQYRPPQGEDDDGEDADGRDEDDLIVIAAVLELPIHHLSLSPSLSASPARLWSPAGELVSSAGSDRAIRVEN